MYATAVCPYCTVYGPNSRCARGVSEIEKVRIDLDPERRAEMVSRTERRTVPQIFIGATHVGGCDGLVALDHAGKLLPLLSGEAE